MSDIGEFYMKNIPLFLIPFFLFLCGCFTEIRYVDGNRKTYFEEVVSNGKVTIQIGYPGWYYSDHEGGNAILDNSLSTSLLFINKSGTASIKLEAINISIRGTGNRIINSNKLYFNPTDHDGDIKIADSIDDIYYAANSNSHHFFEVYFSYPLFQKDNKEITAEYFIRFSVDGKRYTVKKNVKLKEEEADMSGNFFN